MGKNKNNSSTKLGKKPVGRHVAPIDTQLEVDAGVITRSGAAKRSCSDTSREEQPLPKQKKICKNAGKTNIAKCNLSKKI